jgi:hypothetical protein
MADADSAVDGLPTGCESGNAVRLFTGSSFFAAGGVQQQKGPGSFSQKWPWLFPVENECPSFRRPLNRNPIRRCTSLHLTFVQ